MDICGPKSNLTWQVPEEDREQAVSLAQLVSQGWFRQEVGPGGRNLSVLFKI